MPRYGPRSTGSRKPPVSRPQAARRPPVAPVGPTPSSPVRRAPVPAQRPSRRGHGGYQPEGATPAAVHSTKKEYIQGALLNPNPDHLQEQQILGAHLAAELEASRQKLRAQIAQLHLRSMGLQPGTSEYHAYELAYAKSHGGIHAPEPIGKTISRVHEATLGKVEKVPVLGELVGMVDPVLAAEAAKHNLTTPPWEEKGINAGMVFGRPGGIRGAAWDTHGTPPEDLASLGGKGGPKTNEDLQRIEERRKQQLGPPEGVPERRVSPAEQALGAKGANVKPELPGEVVKPPEGPTPGQQVLRSLAGMREARAKQAKLASRERGRRAGEAQKAYYREGGGIAGREAMGPELSGELPKVEYKGLQQLTQGDLETLIREVMDHPKLQFYQKLKAVDGIREAIDHGRAPAPHQIKLLREVFGPDAEEFKQIKAHHHAGHIVAEVLNFPRAFMASADVSAPARQGLILGTRHPIIWAKNFKPMLQAFKSEDFRLAAEQAIRDDPEFALAQEGGLAFTEVGGGPGKEGAPEPYVYSGLAEKVPVAGHVVKASERAYNTYLNKFRFDVFKHVLEVNRKQGRNVEDPAFLKGVSTVLNSASGRGELRLLGFNLEKGAPVFNTLMFSPRLAASRLNFIDPTWYIRLYRTDPYAARMAVSNMVAFTGVVSSILGLATLAGYKVVTDPRNADFAKIKLGDTRIDIMGGLQQDVRLISQLITKTVISSSTGRKLTLGPGYGNLTRWDILLRFATGKAAPVPGVIYDFFRGTMYDNQPFSIKKELFQHLVPLVAQDAIDLYSNKRSVPLTAAGYAAGATGVGIQTYGPPQKAINTFKEQAKKAGMPPPSQEIIKQKQVSDDLDFETKGKKPHEKALMLAKLLDQKENRGDFWEQVAEHYTIEAQAQGFYDDLRPRLFPEYYQYDAQVRARLRGQAARERIK
jgi:hypothetical protein